MNFCVRLKTTKSFPPKMNNVFDLYIDLHPNSSDCKFLFNPSELDLFH